MKNLFSLLLILSLFYACSNNGNQNNSLNTEGSPNTTANATGIFSEIPLADFPFSIKFEDLAELKDFAINDQELISEILDSLKDQYQKKSDVKFVLNIPVKKNFKLFIASVKEDWGFENKMTNYFFVTISPQNKIISVSNTIQDFSEVEGDYINKFVIKNDTDNRLKIIEYFDAEPGMSIDNLNFTEEEKDLLNYYTENILINDNGKLIRQTKKYINTDLAGVYTGTIDDRKVVFKLISYDDERKVYGKFMFLDDENEIILGNYRVPDMTNLIELDALMPTGETKHFTFIPVSDLMGRFEENKTVKLQKTDQSFDSFHKTGKGFAKITNNDFKSYLTYFAITRENLKINNPSEYWKDTELEEIPKEQMKFVDLSLLREDFSYAKFYYGYAYPTDSSFICFLITKYPVNDEPVYSYGIIEYSFSGKIKSFDILEKLPTEPGIRVFVPDKDYDPYYFKNMLDMPLLANENFHKLRIYVDLPTGYKDVNLAVVEFNEGGRKFLLEDEVPYAPNCPRISIFDIEGNFGCNDIEFSLYSLDGADLKSYSLKMHCGE